MASEIRVDKINSLSGVGTVTLSPTGVDIAGITTAATLRATTGIVTSLTAGSLTSLGAVSGTTGTFTGDVDIADKIVHTGDTNTALRFPAADTVSVETGGSERLRIDSNGRLLFGIDSSISGVKIQIASSYIQQYVAGNDANPGYLDILKTRNTSASGNTILQDGDQIGQLRFRGNTGSGYVNGAFIRAKVNGTPGSGNDLPTDLEFHTMPDGSGSTTEKFRIESDGDLRISSDDVGTNYGFIDGWNGAAGNLIIGADQSTTGNASSSDGSAIILRTRGGERARIQHLGGISFNGDTATANALDDYEEGSWTPSFGNLEAGTTYSTQYGRYCRNGSLIQLVGQITASGGGLGSDGSAVNIQGLPYVGNSAAEVCSFTFGRYTSLIPDAKIDDFNNVRFGGNYVMLHEGNNTDIAYSECNSSGTIQFHIAYIINT